MFAHLKGADNTPLASAISPCTCHALVSDVLHDDIRVLWKLLIRSVVSCVLSISHSNDVVLLAGRLEQLTHIYADSRSVFGFYLIANSAVFFEGIDIPTLGMFQTHPNKHTDTRDRQ